MTKKATTSNKPVAKKVSSSSSKNKSGGRGGATAETRIMSAVAHFLSLGKEVADRKEVMQVADMKNESSFKTMCGTVKRKGFVEFPDGNTIKLTEAGIEKVGRAAVEPKGNEEVQAMIMETMKNKKTRDMFEILTDGRVHSLPDLAKAIGYEASAPSFRTYIGGLSKFVEKSVSPDGTKMIRLMNIAFPRGRPNCE